jgi:hypothetical protein
VTADPTAPIRTANRLADAEGSDVTLLGLAVDLAGRRCVHLDRGDAIVPVTDASSWGDLAGRVVSVSGPLMRHAFQNDPETGLSSLEVRPTSIDPVELPDDGVVRTAPALHAAEGSTATVEGMAFRSSNGNILVVAGGLAYVHGLPEWSKSEVATTVRVTGTVTHDALPPEAPPAGGSWVVTVA